MSTFIRLCRSVLLFCSAAAVMPTAAHAQQTLRVPQDFPTIQAALNAAHTGDTVSVGPGTYFENLTIDTKEVTLVSTAGPGVTVLDGRHLGPVLKITNTPGIATAISGFTLQNGSPLGSSAGSLSVGPAGVLIASAGAQIKNSTFQKNAGINVGVINGSLNLTASSLSTASSSGGGCALSAGTGVLNPSTGVYISGTSIVLTSGINSGTTAAADAAGRPLATTIVGNTIFGDGTACSGIGIQAVNLGQPLSIRNNTIRNNALGLSADDAPIFLLQNLVYDNVTGALHLIDRAQNPNVDPATTQIVNNTIVNNLTAPGSAANADSVADVFVDGTAAHIQFLNNILVGTTSHPVLTCATATLSLNDTPLLFANNDLYNTTRAANSLATGDCFPGLANPLTTNGNLTVDPQLAGSTDLHPSPSSPVIDAGTNSAPGLIFIPLVSGVADLDLPLASAASLDYVVASYGPDIVTTTPLSDISGMLRFLDGSGSGHNTIDMGVYEAPRAANSIAGASPSAMLLSSSNYLTPPGPVTFKALAESFTAVVGGSITFSVNGVQQATVPVDSNGVATFSTTLNAPGLYAIVASAPASNLGYLASASTPLYVRVTEAQPLAATTLTIAASPSTQVLNQPVTLMIHLGSINTNGSAQPGPVPPGDVTLVESGTILSSLQPDASGLATYTVPKPSAGSHTYTVNYAGTTMYSSASASTGVTITAPIATSLTARAGMTPVPYGSPVYCSAAVVAASGPAPTGTVVFTDGATPLGSVTLTSHAELGLVSLLLGTTFSPGLHTITVTFQPDPGYGPSSGVCTVTIGGSATTTFLSSSKNPASPTDTVLYTATVTTSSAAMGTVAAPTGSVSLFEGSTLLASAPLVAGAAGSSTAALPVTLASPGSHILTATYIPATAASIASSAMLTETISAGSAAIDLSASPNPASVTQSISLSASVRSASLSSVTISFYDGALLLGRTPPTPSGLFTVAFVLQPGSLSLGSHTLTAVASDAGGDLLGTSNSVVERVSGIASTLVLSATPAPSALATAPVTLSADLSTPLPAGTSVTGSVTFFDGSLPLGSASISPAGHAVLTASTLAVGPHTLTASYSGSSVLAPSASAPVTEQIVLNPTDLQLAAPAHSIAFSPITLTARVSSSTTSTRINTPVCSPACAPVSVTFFANGPAGASTLGIVPVDASGGASLTISPAAGTYTISAAFSGSPLFAASTSATSTLNVTPASTVLTLTANPNPVYQHGSVTLFAALSAPGTPASALTGNITFLEGSTTLGTTTLAGAQSFSYMQTGVGSHTLTAVFSGDASLSGASASVTLTVLASDFSLSVKDTTLTIATTHHAPTTVSINATGALADLIDLTCANLPQNAHCTFSPATHDLTAQNASTGTLTVDTDALLNYAADRAPASSSGGSGMTAAALLALAIPTTLLAGMTRLRRRGHGLPRIVLPHLLAGLLLCAAAVTLSGCSGLYPPHVTPGTYTVTVTGHARSSGIEHSAPLTLVVTQ